MKNSPIAVNVFNFIILCKLASPMVPILATATVTIITAPKLPTSLEEHNDFPI